jgi:hypothetical protein
VIVCAILGGLAWTVTKLFITSVNLFSALAFFVLSEIAGGRPLSYGFGYFVVHCLDRTFVLSSVLKLIGVSMVGAVFHSKV